ncbi:MAG: D-Ala-D-Ala carboxypeptidase family metallohydrolase [Armatimonadia bacterium]
MTNTWTSWESRKDVTRQITALGFPTVKAFQLAMNVGNPLVADGVPGRLTFLKALRCQQDGLVSAHFSVAEFRCPCCQQIWVHRTLLRGLEFLRQSASPRGLTIVSGCRCSRHNKAVGGAADSMHLHGLAADLEPKLLLREVHAVRRFSGIGTWKGLVRHVDCRASWPAYVGTASPSEPARWVY